MLGALLRERRDLFRLLGGAMHYRRTLGKGADTREIEVAKNYVAYTTWFFSAVRGQVVGGGDAPISDLI